MLTLMATSGMGQRQSSTQEIIPNILPILLLEERNLRLLLTPAGMSFQSVAQNFRDDLLTDNLVRICG